MERGNDMTKLDLDDITAEALYFNYKLLFFVYIIWVKNNGIISEVYMYVIFHGKRTEIGNIPLLSNLNSPIHNKPNQITLLSELLKSKSK